MATLNLDRMARRIAAATGLPNPKISIRGMLLTCEIGHYFKGILFERTGRRYSLYLWSVVLPRFHPSRNLALNFSDRLNDGFTLDGSEQEITNQAISCILDTPGLRRRLETALTPSEFLERQTIALAYPQHQPLTVVFDIAASAALGQQHALAIQLLETIKSRTSNDPEQPVSLYADAVLSAIRSGADLVPVLDRVSQENEKI